ncbi:MAG: PAS domain-containing protein [Kiloniellales bacterium]|nr:PAS domain-containing protein [Kiloniellales bacterium]
MNLAQNTTFGDKILWALRYWEGLAGTRPMPTRADLDPLDIPGLLPHIYLLNVFDEPLDFQYRLIGTEIVRHSKRDYTGERVSDLPEQRAPSRIWSLYEQTVTERRPICLRVPYLHIPGRYVQKMAAPLSPDGETVTMIFGVVQFDDSHYPEQQVTAL